MPLRDVTVAATIWLWTLSSICGAAQGDERGVFVDRVLSVFMEGGDHINALRDLRSETKLYPEIVADLTDYAIFGHGTLLDLLFEGHGPAIAAELDRKVKTEVACLPQYVSICQPNLAERNSLILGMLSYYEEEIRARQ